MFTGTYPQIQRGNTDAQSTAAVFSHPHSGTPLLPFLRANAPARSNAKTDTSTSKATVTKEETYWIEVVLRDKEGTGIAFTQVEISFTSGEVRMQRTNEWGVVRIDGLSDTISYKLRLVR